MKVVDWIRNNYWLVIILACGSGLRFYHIDFQSVWLDEIHTLNDANPDFSISEVYASILVADPHPPLYFYIIQILFKIFGYTPLVARSFSVIVGILAIYALYKFGKELINKEVGVISALLLSVNPFHIYYSQDARPYALLCLSTILSFLYLVKYIKAPSKKNAIVYGLFTALMLYGHFFSLFALMSQIVILLYFLFLSKNSDRINFLLNCLIAAFIVAILFIPPSLKIFIAATDIKNFWIQPPGSDVYTMMFKEFFGTAEIITAILGLMITLYFIRLSKENQLKNDYESISNNQTIFSFIILFTWIIIVILIPLVRSYMSIPMIVSRYFINILPAIIVIVTIGISQFKNQFIKSIFILLIFVFSMTDLIIVKSYYTKINKTQFREVTQFIKDNHVNNQPIVTSLGWYFPYFFSNNKYTIINSDLNSYVREMTNDSIKKKDFWYVDAHIRPYNVTQETQDFLDKNFIVENNIDLYDTWTKNFVLLKNSSIDISKYKELRKSNGDSLNFVIEDFVNNSNQLKVSGWAYFPGQVADHTKISMVLIREGKAVKMQTQKVIRTDVTSYFKSDFNIDNSGFSATTKIDLLEPGKYQLGIHAINHKTKKEGLLLTGKVIENISK